MGTPRTAAEIRSAFLTFFEERGHRVARSSALVPQNDPTLLFTNAGMVQFKDLFTGREKRDYVRAATSQKCVRAGGKHNDLENVGYTARHHTFFEMLGNFSFGDYFKQDAIIWAWDFITKVLGLPAEKLAVTIFEGTAAIPADDEAAALWHEQAGVPKDRIFRLGEKDNFWAMGDTGPCGPCSEIHFYQGNDPAALKAGPAAPGADKADGTGWMEIWNLVFMQFERDASGTLTPLPKPSIDTGAGLERIAAVVQGKRTNYDTDLLQAIVQKAAQLSGKSYETGTEEQRISMRVIADHARATTFLVGDGVLPSNEGRGYTLRRIMRRAIRHGTLLGLDKPFLHEVCRTVIAEMKGAFPDLVENESFITEVAKNEEEGFRRTLARGLQLISEEIEARASGEKRLPGEVVFKLYDTYGFPEDLTRIVAGERGFSVDEEGFQQLLEQQRSRSTFVGTGDAAVAGLWMQLAGELGATKFTGYEGAGLEGAGKVLALVVGGQRVAEAKAGDEVDVVLDTTPFYGESGGQLGDTGELVAEGVKLVVSDTIKPTGGLHVHRAKLEQGALQTGAKLTTKVDGHRRAAIRRNHSATHLLHEALREVLGDHVKQAGSVVGPDALRFDYAHMKAPTPEELERIEARVNHMILDNASAATELMSLDAAKASGATALFGEKYGEAVRVVQVHPDSRELCGGTHVARTGDIGFFKLTQEGSIASGTRRLVGVTGEGAVAFVQARERELKGAAAHLRVSPDELAVKLEGTLVKFKELEKELQRLNEKLAASRSGELVSLAREIKGVKVISTRAEGDAKALRELADKLRDKLGSGVVVLGGEAEGKAVLLVAVTADLNAKGIKAGDLVRELAKEVGGKGGGKPDLAQAGGPDVGKLDAALQRVYELL